MPGRDEHCTRDWPRDIHPQRIQRARRQRRGQSERAGFIDAPQIGPANIASSAMSPPMAMPAVIPFIFFPVATERIVSIRIAVRMISSAKDRPLEPKGIVAPRVACSTNMARSVQLAAKARRTAR